MRRDLLQISQFRLTLQRPKITKNNKINPTPNKIQSLLMFCLTAPQNSQYIIYNKLKMVANFDWLILRRYSPSQLLSKILKNFKHPIPISFNLTYKIYTLQDWKINNMQTILSPNKRESQLSLLVTRVRSWETKQFYSPMRRVKIRNFQLPNRCYTKFLKSLRQIRYTKDVQMLYPW